MIYSNPQNSIPIRNIRTIHHRGGLLLLLPMTDRRHLNHSQSTYRTLNKYSIVVLLLYHVHIAIL